MAHPRVVSALDAAGLELRGPYQLRHTFATEALAVSVSTFELARLVGTPLAMIDHTYGHLARDSEDSIRPSLRGTSPSGRTTLRGEALGSPRSG